MKEDKYTDVICRRFCSFYKEGKEELQCGTYILLRERFSPEEIERLVADIGNVPDLSADKAIYEFICSKCEFLVDGCGYREGLDSPPCGGYNILEHLIMNRVIK